MLFRGSVNTGIAEAWVPDVLDQAWRGVSGALRALTARLGQRRAIRVPDVSEEWLAGHEAEAGKHRDG